MNPPAPKPKQPARWNAAQLDAARLVGDPLADACVESITHNHGAGRVYEILNLLRSEGPLPSERECAALFEDVRRAQQVINPHRFYCGATIFWRYSLPTIVVLALKSLMEGYASRPLSQPLAATGELLSAPLPRLKRVLGMITSVTQPHALEGDGLAFRTATRLRLIHAVVRKHTRQKLPDFERSFGVPVNQEDMLATIMGFGPVMLEGFSRLQVQIASDAEDYVYLWNAFGHMCGIDADLIPNDKADSEAFYKVYAQRHYVDADQNPHGVELAQCNLTMLRELLPGPFEWMGHGVLMTSLLRELVGDEMCAKLGIELPPPYPLLQRALRRAPRMWSVPWDVVSGVMPHAADQLSRRFVQHVLSQATEDGAKRLRYVRRLGLSWVPLVPLQEIPGLRRLVPSFVWPATDTERERPESPTQKRR